MSYNYSKLQNGSDIRGVAIASPEHEVNLDATAAKRFAKAFLFLVKSYESKDLSDVRIAIGRDSRISGPDLLAAAAEGITACGATALDCGIASTPAMFMSTVFEETNCDGAIMITASHMPSDRNGLKFFLREGGLDKGDITDIINIAESDQILAQLTPFGEQTKRGELIPCNLIDIYSAHLRKVIVDGVGSGETPLEGLRITVDAGNGAGGFYATKVLAPLGADVSSSQFLEPDGTFPNHIPNPENKEAITSICNAVKVAGTDLGIIFDTDVDRASAVDEKGSEISRNGIVALAAALVSEVYPGSTVVTDSVTSLGLKKFIEDELGLRHLRFRRGYKNVINKGIELNDAGEVCGLAIETSGHAAFKDNYFLDDGAYLATLIVIKTALLAKQGKKISELLAGLEHPAEAMEARLPLTAPNFGEIAEAAITALRDAVSEGSVIAASLEEPNYEGVRINFFDGPCDDPSGEPTGWLLLRKSLHDPIMPLNIESDTEGGCAEIAAKILPILEQFPEIDVEKLK